MNDQLRKYLDRTDKNSSALMLFIYIVNIVMNLAILIPAITNRFRPGMILEMDDIHAAVAVMYMTMNLILIHQIKKYHDEFNRSYLLICYSVLVTIDVIVEQIIIIFVLRSPDMIYHVFSRTNILYLVANAITIAIYLNRYLALKHKYELTTGRM